MGGYIVAGPPLAANSKPRPDAGVFLCRPLGTPPGGIFQVSLAHHHIALAFAAVLCAAASGGFALDLVAVTLMRIAFT
jgi:hypothetical protein